MNNNDSHLSSESGAHVTPKLHRPDENKSCSSCSKNVESKCKLLLVTDRFAIERRRCFIFSRRSLIILIKKNWITKLFEILINIQKALWLVWILLLYLIKNMVMKIPPKCDYEIDTYLKQYKYVLISCKFTRKERKFISENLFRRMYQTRNCVTKIIKQICIHISIIISLIYRKIYVKFIWLILRQKLIL